MTIFQNNSNLVLTQVSEKLSETSGQNVVVRSSTNLGGGCINHASKLETNIGDFFLKWNAYCAPDIFQREAESLTELRKATENHLIVPKVIAAKEVDSTPGFLILEYLKPGHSKFGDDEKLGRGLALLHLFSNLQFGFYHHNYCGATLQNNEKKDSWAEFFRDNRLSFLLQLIQKERPIPSSEMIVYEKLLQKIEKLIPNKSTPVLIHGDLWSGNYMTTENGPALIDPASYYADYEMEFAIMTMFGGFSQRFYDAYNEVNPLPADWKQRNSLYQLYHVLNHYYLFGGGYRTQAFQIAKSYV